MKEFNLEDERWFKDIFENKEAWVPTYFNYFPRCGLLKTTLISESTNSFFNLYSQTENLFLNFMMNYDNAIQKRRYCNSPILEYQFMVINSHDLKVYSTSWLPDLSSSSGLVHVFKWPTRRVQEGTQRVGVGG